MNVQLVNIWPTMESVKHIVSIRNTRNTFVAEPCEARGRKEGRPVKCHGWEGGEK